MSSNKPEVVQHASRALKDLNKNPKRIRYLSSWDRKVLNSFKKNPRLISYLSSMEKWVLQEAGFLVGESFPKPEEDEPAAMRKHPTVENPAHLWEELLKEPTLYIFQYQRQALRAAGFPVDEKFPEEAEEPEPEPEEPEPEPEDEGCKVEPKWFFYPDAGCDYQFLCGRCEEIFWLSGCDPDCFGDFECWQARTAPDLRTEEQFMIDLARAKMLMHLVCVRPKYE